MAKYIVGQLFDKEYPVTQIYGANPDYYKQFGLPGHEGVDYGTPNGTPVLAPFDGVILRDTFNDKDYGNFTVVWDSQQLCAVWFCHLQDVTTQIGQQVKKGDLLGHTNNTGNTTGPHCHVNFVETDINGNRLNKDNGYQGFLNILDINLVSFALQPPLQQPDSTLQQQLDAKKKAYDDLYIQDQDNLHTISQQKDVIDNLNQQINDRNNDITQLNAEVQKKETELQARDQEITILKPIAAQLPNLKDQLAQSEQNCQLCLNAQSNQNIKIANLEAQIALGRPKNFKEWITYIFNLT